jgi:undecaprenyl-phosphate 4-deoxy-4-formamido-L-arabinose transferase
MDISIVVPVFKGEKTLEKLFEGIHQKLKSFSTYEVLFVHDHGSQKSWDILKTLKKRYPDMIRIFKLKKNYGQHNATLFGISEAQGDLIITMDEDLQHDPGYLVNLIEKQNEGNLDVVYGRFLDPKHSLFRNLASKILRKLLKFLIPGLGYYSSFRIIKKDVAKKIVSLKNSYTFIDAGLQKITPEIGFMNIDHRENTTRKSTYTIIRLASHAFQIILAYTRITTWLFVISLVVLFFGGISILSDLTGHGTQILIITTGLILLLASISGAFFHKYHITSNLLPVIALEKD